ncbi:MAG: hypothetical protein ACREXI_11115 [Caldimonas sp.]
MRASPPIEVVLNRFGWWRGALLGLALAAIAVLAAWVRSSVDVHAHAMVAAAGLAGLVCVAGVLSAAVARPARLKWDGRSWQLGGIDTALEPRPGSLRVQIDLGAWMLLRFAADVSDEGRRVVWLPVQRRGLEVQWHALRCAVHAPPPAPDAR